jgi:hypothetical protein
MYTALVSLGRKSRYDTTCRQKGVPNKSPTVSNISILNPWSRQEPSLVVGRCTELDSDVAVTK